jgi:hypothetical protein
VRHGLRQDLLSGHLFVFVRQPVTLGLVRRDCWGKNVGGRALTVRRLILQPPQQMGGTLALRNEPGRGSTFSVTLALQLLRD